MRAPYRKTEVPQEMPRRRIKAESASESRPDQKRGRPPVLSAEDLAIVRNLAPEATSLRSQYNRIYLLRAIRVLDNDPKFRWLLDAHDALLRGEGEIRQYSILTALGQIEDPDDLRQLALLVCKKRLSAKAGIEVVSRWRRRRLELGSALGLANALTTAFNDYFRRHPRLTDDDIEGALAAVAARMRRRQN
jgi:hypothetical protein